MKRTLSVIGAPSSAGAYAPGQEKAPRAFRQYGLMQALTDLGLEVQDRGDVQGFRWRPDVKEPMAMNLKEVRRVALAVSHGVAEAMAREENALVLGGDCTVELGTIAGASRAASSVGLVYIDLDVDLNPPAQSDGALDWTGVAHLLNLPGTRHELSELANLRAEQVLFVGCDNITPPEAQTMKRLNLAQISLAEVKADPVEAGLRAANWGTTFERLAVHVDADVLSYVDFPIAENVRRCNGLTLGELEAVLTPLLRADNWRTLTLAEINPDHAPDKQQAFQTLIGLLANLLKPPAG
jgi:arginase